MISCMMKALKEYYCVIWLLNCIDPSEIGVNNFNFQSALCRAPADQFTKTWLDINCGYAVTKGGKR